ncbi:MAG TPA: hypothetical protein GX507_01300 [Clostridia bacterium]|nr:hypothetical protein [Clostridia bacterium]
MILYTPIPEEVVLSSPGALGVGGAVAGKEERAFREIRLSVGRTLVVEDADSETSRVVRLISTNPSDYLLEGFQPGTVFRRVSPPANAAL